MSPKSLKKIVKRKIQFVKQPIENYLIKKNHRRVNQYAKFYKNHDVLKNTILYESRDGGSMTDSPYAMFTYMLEHPDFKNYEHVWSIADVDALSAVIAKYEQHPNVKFVKRGSREYMRRLATSEYLINNSTFQSFFVPKPNQTYVNTWHGTPLKSMGFDIPGDPSHSQNVVRNFLSADYLLSPNAHTTRMYTDSYKLDGLYRGKIIEEGYPRIDLTLNSDPVNVRGQLRQYGLRLDGKKKTLLYAPTWKGKRVSEVNNDLPQIIADMKELQDEIGDAYNVLVKVHPFLYKEAANDPGIAAHLVPDFVDSNELLAAVDVLVTDYSSIFFDFLVTGRPILFYTWDLDEYSEERGQYFDRAELPGPILLNVKELAAVVKTIESVQETYRDRYSAMRERFTCHDDGKVTERIVGYLFNRQPEKLNTITCAPDKKEKLLIYPGGMKDNGITSSFVNLMNNLDYNRYDVTCFTGTPRNQEALKNLAKLNENVRLLFKPGLPVYTVTEVYKNQLIQNRGERGWLGKLLFPEAAYKREHARLFGHASFDYVIDFSGYSLYWAKYLVVAEAKKKICFMHNDLLSDSERTINGRRPHRVNLRGMFTLYHRFDKLV
ncbi:MAG TPA: CDP-glycerol glycerophosphotransferase family protein, partial [Bacillales bacterium]|nr:CDP-glycerol glycerophosphotransferase family protein [Bacillales bacterium]